MLVLEKGAVLRATVVKTPAPGSVLLRIDGQDVSARTHLPLKPGMRLVLNVLQNQGPVVLQVQNPRAAAPLLPNTAAVFSALGANVWKALLTHLESPTGCRQGFDRLKALLQRMVNQGWPKPAPEAVNALFTRSGLLFEHKLRRLAAGSRPGSEPLSAILDNDLKGALAECLNRQDRAAGLVQRLFSALEQLQMLNHAGRQEEGRLFLPFPIRMPGGEAIVAQLMIRLLDEEAGGPAGGKNEGFCLQLVLELPRLGPIRIDLSYRRDQIRAMFAVCQESARQAVIHGMPTLERRLAQQGLSFEYMGCLIRDAQSVSKSPLADVVDSGRVFFNCLA